MSLVSETRGLTTGGRGQAKPDHYDLPPVVIGHWSRSSGFLGGVFEGACPLMRAPPRAAKHHTGVVREHPSVKAPKAAREQDGSEEKVHNSGVCPYTSQILQLEERPWPVSACARVFFLRCRRRRKKTDSPTRRTRSRRTRPFGHTPNRPEARCRLNRPRPTSRPPGLP